MHTVLSQGKALEQVGALQQAVQLYQQWLSLHPSKPQAAAVGFNLGVLLRKLKDSQGAVQAYEQALRLAPGLWQIWYNLGLAYEALGQGERATQAWQQGVAQLQSQNDPAAQAQLLMQLGRYYEKSEPDRAMALLEQALRLAPDPGAAQHYLALRRQMCLWPVVPQWLRQAYPQQDFRFCMGPFMALAESDDPYFLGQVVRSFLGTKPAAPQPLPPAPAYQHERLRIGYLSADFRWHAVSILMAEVFELHDRSRVEVYGFDYSDTTPSPMRQRVIAAFDHHEPVHELADVQVAQRIRELEIDVLIDLTGLTASSRYAILGYQAAPVQVNYLGFPGSSHIPGISHILVDETLVPEPMAHTLAEQPLYLRSFQANDRQRKIGRPLTRAECGLPEDAVVYCAFNNNYKFTPEMWTVWMRVLQRTPGSVLWVATSWAQVVPKLQAQAQQLGVDPKRLVFAPKVVPEQYLARMQCADLFLDTRPFGAGTTASDALWAGLPLLTCPGRSFASRMAASVLTAAGLPELIAPDLAAYEELAVALGTDPPRLLALRQKLARQRDTCTLFDTPAFVRDLEDTLQAAVRSRAC